MNKIFFIFGLLVLAANGKAQNLSLSVWQDATVKVLSFPCHGQRPLFEGTGLLVQHEQTVQVLTSEHVIIQSQDSRFCHEIVTRQGLRKKVFLNRFSLEDGFATLRVSDEAELRSRAIEFIPGQVSEDLPLIALGFPKSEFSLQALTQGQLVSANSHRALIPGIENMIEASQLPVEYGMSGGLMLQKKSLGQYSLVGFLSHQILRRDLSQGSSVVSNDSSMPIRLGDFVLAIPAIEGLRYLQDTSVQSLFWRRDPLAQLNGREVFIYGPLKIGQSQTAFADVFPVGGRGGADGAGVGGADGAGIGGTEVIAPAISLNSVKVELDMASGPELRQLDLREPLLNFWKTELLRGGNIQIPFLKVQNESRLSTIHSLSSFLTLWRRGATPVALTSPSEERLKSLRSAFNVFLWISQNMKEEQSSIEMKAWLGMISDTVIAAQVGLASSRQLRDLREGENSSVWSQLYADSFDRTVELAISLEQILTQMQELGL